MYRGKKMIFQDQDSKNTNIYWNVDVEVVASHSSVKQENIYYHEYENRNNTIYALMISIKIRICTLRIHELFG